ncbi:MAG: protein kinase, partial [Myxococcota bacterium]
MSDETTLNGAANPITPSPGQEGDLIAGRYRLKGLLGAGGMGRVFEAEHTATGGQLAVKLTHGGDDAMARFASEARTTASLLHPNIVRLFDFGRDSHTHMLFLAMEYVPGRTLKTLLADLGVLPWRRAATILEQLLMALGYAHARGIVHRDIKPSNILITHFLGREDFVRLVDFGIAHALRDAPQEQAGTPAYMAPEQWRGASTTASDLYALGCVAYALTAGSPPFQGSIEALHHHHHHTQPTPLTGPLSAWTARLLVKDPKARPTALEALTTLRALTSHSEPSSVATHAHLPIYRDAFVGRHDALAALDRLETTGASCITLLGPAGVGKSRLAVEWAQRRAADHDSVAFCGLADVTTVDGACAAIAQTLEVRLGAGDPAHTLGETLARRGRMLLVLDNMETLAETLRPVLTAWQDAAPETLLFTTSRTALRLDGESVLPLEPLGLPSEQERDPKTLRSSDAVTLLVRRAQNAHTGWRWDAQDPQEVAALVRELDGLPLAIELAAARLRLLTVPQLRARLGARLALLKGQGDGRHATLTSALDVSWDLLDDQARATFTQCAVFQGGFTLEAAEAVLNAPIETVHRLETLVDQSLMQVRDTAHGPRFTMYAFVHDYARHHQDPEHTQTISSRHLAHMAALGSEDTLAGLERNRETLALLGHEWDNLEAARRWGLDHGHHHDAALCSLALGEYVYRQGPVSRGQAVVEEALAALPDDAPTRPRLHFLGGKLAWSAGDADRATQHYEAGLAVCAVVDDPVSEASLHYGLGVLDRLGGRMDEAVHRYERSLQCAAAAGSETRQGWALMGLAVVRRIQGDGAQAATLLDRSLGHSRASGDARLEGSVLHVLGTLLESQGQPGPAAGCFEQAVECARQTGDRRMESAALMGLGSALEQQGQLNGAAQYHRDCLTLAREAGDRWLEGAALAGLGHVQTALGHLTSADRTLREAASVARHIGDINLVGWVRCTQSDLALLTDHPATAQQQAQ